MVIKLEDFKDEKPSTENMMPMDANQIEKRVK
jgi:hypothetical protein